MNKFWSTLRPYTFAFLFLTSACDFSKKAEHDHLKDNIIHDDNNNHDLERDNILDLGNSKPEIQKDTVRVRSQAERDRMARYLAELVRPEDIVTSIELPSGDICDCVAVDRQPALRAQELKGHKISFDPPAPLEEEETRMEEAQDKDPASDDQLIELLQEYGQEGKTCPEKTVPILRLTMEILDNFETLDDFLKARPPHELTGPTARHQYASGRFNGDNWGGQSSLNIWSPYTEKSSEFSLSQIAIARGSGANRETVEAGWQKYRQLYGDYRPRLFIYFTPDNYGSGGCYNLSCGGFVQVNNSVFIGGGFSNISSHPHPSTAWEITLRWQRHGETGDWWLKYGNTWVGYYPSNLFDDNGLRPRASRATFYGEIIDDTSGSRHTRTDMGSGHFPGSGFGYAAYQRRIRTITTSNYWNIRPSLSITRTDANCYDIIEYNSSGSWERYFYFGGPGYNYHCR